MATSSSRSPESLATRRALLAGAAVGAAVALWPRAARAASGADALAALRSGQARVVMIRHAQTEPGVGDPPGFDLAVCATQRNLSEAGREQSRRIGRWFERAGLRPQAVRSSAWCRCQDTARLAFGQVEVWPALNSTFGDRVRQPDQTETLRAALGRMPAGRLEVWVTHQVNMTALTSEGVSMGEGFVLDARGRIMARTLFEG